LGYVLYSWLADDVIRGWASIMFVLLILGSLHLCALAVVGQYVGRTYVQSKNRPLFLIDEVVCLPGRPGEEQQALVYEASLAEDRRTTSD
jgi:dolichol-phosphate mannosyltransferase